MLSCKAFANCYLGRVKISQNRMRSVTEVRAAMSETLDDAAKGHTTHILRDGQVIAHLVPADALVLDREPRLVDLLVESMCQRTIAFVAAEDPTAGVQQSDWATFLAFLRDCPRLYARAFTLFVAYLWQHLGPQADVTVDVVSDWLGRDGRELLGPPAELTEVVRQAVAAAPDMIELIRSRERERAATCA